MWFVPEGSGHARLALVGGLAGLGQTLLIALIIAGKIAGHDAIYGCIVVHLCVVYVCMYALIHV